MHEDQRARSAHGSIHLQEFAEKPHALSNILPLTQSNVRDFTRLNLSSNLNSRVYVVVINLFVLIGLFFVSSSY